MPKSFRAVCRLWGAVPLLLLAACGAGGPAYAPAGSDPIIEMTSGLSFSPAEVEVSVGQTVEWRNTSLFTHSVTTDPAKVSDPTQVALPEGAAPFHRTVPPGEIFRHAFTVPGVYEYVCVPHEDFDMRGRVVVRPAD